MYPPSYHSARSGPEVDDIDKQSFIKITVRTERTLWLGKEPEYDFTHKVITQFTSQNEKYFDPFTVALQHRRLQ